MKRFLTAAMAAVMLLSLCSCGSKKEEEHSAGLANPVHDCTRDELLNATGIVLDAPDGAENIRYSYIDTGSEPISQVVFTLDGNEFCYRAQPTASTSIMANLTDENASLENLSKALSECTNIGAALSGMHYDWKTVCLIDVGQSCDGIVAFNEGKQGIITWLDVVPGILYSLSVNSNASQSLLMETAEACFVPVQGDVG